MESTSCLSSSIFFSYFKTIKTLVVVGFVETVEKLLIPFNHWHLLIIGCGKYFQESGLRVVIHKK